MLIAVVASPFLWLIYAILMSVRHDRELAAEVETRFLSVDCVVLSSAVRPLTRLEVVSPGSTQKRQVQSGYDPIISFRYQWQGSTFESQRFAPVIRTLSEAEADAFLQTYRAGSAHSCRVDPTNPGRAFIAR